jgi:hypothetical protein
MVDMATYKLMHPASTAAIPPTHPLDRDVRYAKLDPWPVSVKKTEDLSAKASMLLPSTIFGFRIQAKKWSEQVPSPCGVKLCGIVCA